MFVVEFKIARRFMVNAGHAEAFAFLKDVPRSAEQFPGIAALEPLSENAYRWRMVKIGLSMLSLETTYACRYKSDESREVIQWTPMRKEGNAQVQGSWRLKMVGEKQTEVKLHSSVRVEVPLPALARALLAPLVSREYNKLVDRYVENLTKALDSGAVKSPPRKIAVKKTAKPKAKPRVAAKVR